MPTDISLTELSFSGHCWVQELGQSRGEHQLGSPQRAPGDLWEAEIRGTYSFLRKLEEGLAFTKMESSPYHSLLCPHSMLPPWAAIYYC